MQPILTSLHSRRRLWFAACATILGALTAAVPAQKGAKPTAPPPAGTIYFTFDNQTYRMKADGSAKTVLPAVLTGFRGEPSRFLHGGVRWWIVVTSGELFAMAEPGGAPIPITDAADGVTAVLQPARFAHDDSFISYVGIDGSGAREVHRRQLTWTGGFPTPGAADVPLPSSDVPIGYMLTACEWSPDAMRLVFGVRTLGAGQDQSSFLHIKEIGAPPGSTRFLTNGIDPRWAPDGSRIAFRGYYFTGDIGTILPDGTGSTIILRGHGTHYDCPRWAPSSGHLAYHQGPLLPGNRGSSDLYRATPSGGSKTSLTGDLPTDSYRPALPIAWCADQ